MIIGVVGNRVGWTYEFVSKKLEELGVEQSDIIVSGGAMGVDTFAQQYAMEIGAEIQIIYPRWKLYGRSAGFIRNEIIAIRCEKLIAFNKEENSGTANTIKQAKKFGKEVIIISEGK